jgi:dipeptidase D
MFVKLQQTVLNKWMKETFGDNDPNMHCRIKVCEKQSSIINPKALEALTKSLKATPQGVIKMSEVMEGTVETSNNIGVVETRENSLFVSTHSRSFIDADLEKLSDDIATVFKSNGFSSKRVMMAPAWQEDQHSAFLQLTSDTFNDVLGWRPRMVAMHFVLEAGYFVQTYPGIQIASIGPRIVEPHSTSERIELSTIHDIWAVLLELLARLATA